MAEAGRVEAGAVVVDRGRAVDDLVAAVAVHVADAEVVVALPAPAGVRVRRAGVAGVERPDVRERAVAPVPGREHRARVVAARHHQARPLAVEIRDGGEEAVDAVAVGVAPVADRAARDDVGRGRQRGAGLAVEDGEELGPGQDVARRVAPVGGGIADHGARAVNGAVRGLARDLGFAVAVEVVDDELRVVRARADVAAEVDPPQPRAGRACRRRGRRCRCSRSASCPSRWTGPT